MGELNKNMWPPLDLMLRRQDRTRSVAPDVLLQYLLHLSGNPLPERPRNSSLYVVSKDMKGVDIPDAMIMVRVEDFGRELLLHMQRPKIDWLVGWLIDWLIDPITIYRF